MSEKALDRLVSISFWLIGIGFICFLIWILVLVCKEPSHKTIDISPSPDTHVVTMNLEPGEKLQTINWERDNNHGYIYILTRPMRSDETPEVYKYRTINNVYATIYEIHERGVDDVGND